MSYRRTVVPPIVAAVTVLATVAVARPASGAVGEGSAFRTAPLPVATGVTTTSGRNEDIEPGLAVDGGGTFWAGSDIDVNVGGGDPRAGAPLSGEDVWRSDDGGLTYRWVADPFDNPGRKGLAGEDSDIAAAPETNPQGHYNVYAVSLYVANTTLALSQDGGATWSLNPLAGVPAQDRPWVTADGPCVFYVTYHQLPLFAPVVNRYDTCSTTDLGLGIALNPVQATPVFLSNSVPGLTNDFNKPVVDTSAASPHRHTLYVPMEACDLQTPSDYLLNVVGTAEQVPTCPAGVNTVLEMAVSTDGGATFNDVIVARGDNNEQEVWGPTAAVDRDGTVYMAWSDNHDAYLVRSTDGGSTWSAPRRVNTAPATTVVYPTLAAGAAGQVAVAYYGTDRHADANSLHDMGTPGDPKAAWWHLYSARSRDGGDHWAQDQASGVIHTGELCTFGGGCTDVNSRNLYDDFGAVISPTTGRLSIAFSADQPLTPRPAHDLVDPFTGYATELPAQSATAAAPPSGAGGTGGVAAAAATPAPSAAPAIGLANTAAGTPGTSAAAGLAVVALLGAGALRRRRRRPPRR